jgi:hypothetical protein
MREVRAEMTNSWGDLFDRELRTPPVANGRKWRIVHANQLIMECTVEEGKEEGTRKPAHTVP